MESYYYGRDGLSVMAVQPDLSDTARRAREIEAFGYHQKPPRDGEKFSTWATSFDDIDPLSVNAQRRYVERMEPEWVERVQREWETYRDVASVIFWSELQPETVIAILQNLHDKNELALEE